MELIRAVQRGPSVRPRFLSCPLLLSALVASSLTSPSRPWTPGTRPRNSPPPIAPGVDTEGKPRSPARLSASLLAVVEFLARPAWGRWAVKALSSLNPLPSRIAEARRRRPLVLITPPLRRR
jgi:hypothetical protein